MQTKISYYTDCFFVVFGFFSAEPVASGAAKELLGGEACGAPPAARTAQLRVIARHAINQMDQRRALQCERVYARQRRLPPVHMVCVGKANQADRRGMHVRDVQKRAYSVRERKGEIETEKF